MYLKAPETLSEKIAYATILPYYNSLILSHYEKVQSGFGMRVYEMILKEIYHLDDSWKNWTKLGGDLVSWTQHIQNCGYNLDFKNVDFNS